MENKEYYRHHLLYPLYLNFAQRSLLGGGKGSFVMDELKAEDPQFYSYVMDEALLLQKDNLSKNLNSRERLKLMVELVKGNMNNMKDIVSKNKGEEFDAKI
jgi:hypothetical protein